MLLVEVTIKDEKEYWQVVELVRGEEVHPEERLGEGRMRAHVLMTDDQFAEAQRRGFECRLITDYSKQPDPREEISKTNRFEAELRRLRDKEGRR